MLNRVGGGKISRAPGPTDLSLAEQGNLVGEGQGKGEVLLHQQYGQPVLLETREHGLDLGDDERCEAFGRLIEQEKARIGEERARHGKHLLLAAREGGAAAGASLAEARKQSIDPLDPPPLA